MASRINRVALGVAFGILVAAAILLVRWAVGDGQSAPSIAIFVLGMALVGGVSAELGGRRRSKR